MKTKTYKGWLGQCEYGFLSISEDKNESYGPSLADLIADDWEKGEKVSLRYYIAGAPMTEEQANEALIHKIYSGDLDAEYLLDAYSEYTVLEWEEGLKIGGHNLIEELETHDGKYAVIVVEASDFANKSDG
jgi:hypothetical protein